MSEKNNISNEHLGTESSEPVVPAADDLKPKVQLGTDELIAESKQPATIIDEAEKKSS